MYLQYHHQIVDRNDWTPSATDRIMITRIAERACGKSGETQIYVNDDKGKYILTSVLPENTRSGIGAKDLVPACYTNSP